MNTPIPPAPNFFALLRQIEHANCGKPLLGKSLRLRDDPVRLGQRPFLDFATQDFKREETIQAGRLGAVRKLFVQHFGLLGPNGALPLHFTEHAYTRIHQCNDPTFSEFLDIFHPRASLLFYMAWAESQPHIAYHRSTFNPFAQHLNCLLGHGVSSSWGREALPTHFRAGLAGHFTRRTKTQEGLARSLYALTGLPVRIVPFQAQWLQLPVQAGALALGRGAMLGSKVRCAQSKIKIDIGPMAYSAYTQWLPATEGRMRLIQASHAYLGLEFDCEFELQVNPDQIPRARLNGGAQLGRTAWLGQMQIHLRKQQPATVRVKCPAVPSHSSLFRSST